MSGLRVLAGTAALALALGLSALGGATAQPLAGVSTSGVGPLRATGLTEVVDVSSNGVIVLGRLGGFYVVRDVVKNKTLRKLPTGPGYAYHGLSAKGRYVAYSFTAAGSSTCNLPFVRDRVTNKARLMATNIKGKPLVPGWSSGPCPEEPLWTQSVTYSAPALSGNGRYVAFCVNLAVADRLDLYLKDRRTGKLRTWPGACSEHVGDDRIMPQDPQISQDGRVVLLPGRRVSGDTESDTWQAGSLLVSGQLRSGVYGRAAGLTEDGSAVFSIAPNSCADPFQGCLESNVRYDVLTGVTSTLSPGDPGPRPMSLRGRYVVSLGGSPADGTQSIGVFDRTTTVRTDLTGTFAGSGVIPTSEVSRTLLSSNGRVLLTEGFTGGSGSWYALTWM